MVVSRWSLYLLWVTTPEFTVTDAWQYYVETYRVVDFQYVYLYPWVAGYRFPIVVKVMIWNIRTMRKVHLMKGKSVLCLSPHLEGPCTSCSELVASVYISKCKLRYIKKEVPRFTDGRMCFAPVSYRVIPITKRMAFVPVIWFKLSMASRQCKYNKTRTSSCHSPQSSQTGLSPYRQPHCLWATH